MKMQRFRIYDFISINKIMSYHRSDSPSRVFDALEQAYNNEAYQHKQQQRRKKQLYFKIANMDMSSKSQMKNLEKQLQSKQTQRVNQHLRMQNQLYAEQQRRKRNYIDEVRHKNQSMSIDIMQKAKEKEDFQHYNDFNDYYMYQMQKQKKEKEEFLRNAEEYEIIRKQKERQHKEIEKRIDQQKKYQEMENHLKREAELKRIRDRHQPVSPIQHKFEEIQKRKQYEEKALEEYIVNQGRQDQQAKLLEMRYNHQARYQDKLDQHVRQLKKQIDDDSIRQAQLKRMQIQKERYQMDQKNRYFSEAEKMNNMRKSQENKRMLEMLKRQVKPRKLIADAEKIEKVGLGSPANIGKVMGDDRKRQLDWIEKSLLKEIHY